jgi:cysteinyl-tRNA synthetase
MHANMLTLNGKKMSKSAGNSLLPNELFSGENELLNKGFDPMVVRFFMMQAHYRSTLDFTSEALSAAEKGFKKLMVSVENLELIVPSNQSTLDVSTLIDSFYAAMDDDFNAPALVANLFEAVKQINAVLEDKESLNKEDLNLFKKEMNGFVFDVLGLKPTIEKLEDDRLVGVMDLMMNLRSSARENKDWATSDKIRDGLLNAGINVKDEKNGASWK